MTTLTVFALARWQASIIVKFHQVIVDKGNWLIELNISAYPRTLSSILAWISPSKLTGWNFPRSGTQRDHNLLPVSGFELRERASIFLSDMWFQPHLDFWSAAILAKICDNFQLFYILRQSGIYFVNFVDDSMLFDDDGNFLPAQQFRPRFLNSVFSVWIET